MGMTMTQKILAAHAGLPEVHAGDLIEAQLDIVLGNDVTTPVAIGVFEANGFTEVFDPEKIVIALDHYTPCKDIKSAELCVTARNFAHKHNISHLYDVGTVGIEHALLPEQGLVGPGDCIIGADSHTCTYGALGAFSTGVGSTDMAAGMASGLNWFKVPSAIKVELTGKPGPFVSGKDVILHLIGEIGVDGALYQSLEFTGSGVSELSMDDRFTIANMAIEAGGKSGIIAVDDITKEFLSKVNLRSEPKLHYSDEGANYDQIITIDVSKLEPVIAYPYLPSNGKSVSQAVKDDIKIDQAFIGSCTNGRLSDLRIAAQILKGKRVAKHTRLIITPATQKIALQAQKEGLMDIFVEAGAVVSNPTCGACLGGYMGILGAGERCISTTNRNFVGRMGDRTSEVYLANSAVAAASAIAGKIVDPRDI